MITLWRIFSQSWKNLFRNAWLGAATIFVFIMALLSVNVVLAVNVLLTRVVAVLEDKVDVTVTFQPATPDAVVTQARFYLTSLPQIAGVSVISADQALADFRSRHEKDPKILAALDELKANPLGSQLVVKAKDAADYPFLLGVIQNPQYASFIQSRTYDDHQLAIQQVETIGNKARITGAILVAIFAFFGMLTAFNAIRVAIYAQREEIAIMRLVGASTSYIRTPFILGGIWLAAVAIILSYVLLFAALHWIEPVLRPLFEGVNPGLIVYFQTEWPVVLLSEVFAMVGLIALVSWAAVGKYIKR
ncbi:MAG TPA: permease-like cell division protein FtsX [Patescibacteria group bacterium]|nr:permease-like cell division protein FtsX [Patescibacteria group bacterium]